MEMAYAITLVNENGIEQRIADTDTSDRRASIQQLEDAMLQGETTEIDTKHHFAGGVYAREIFIPAGTTLTGKIHKTEHLNIISKGDISVATEDGVQRIKAPYTIVSKPGTKRVGYAHEDTVWTTIHGSKEKDLDKLELEFIAESHEDYLAFEQNKRLEDS